MDSPQFAKNENNLIRRLGIAVADMLGALPSFTQDLILDQACEIETWPAGN